MSFISGAATVTGLIGWPVSHSLSPKLHGYWLQKHGIDGSYVPLPVEPERVEQAIAGLPALGIAGVNVTVPHKQAVIPCLDRIEATAERLGAVNTILVHKDGTLEGHNTDAYGFRACLDRQAGPEIKRQIEENRQVTVVGAGGAARAVIDAVLQAGYRRLVITNRTLDKARHLSDDFQQFYPQADISACDWAERAELLMETGLLINTTSLGMIGKPPLDLDLTPLQSDAVVADIVYAPLITPLLSAARDRDLKIVDGLDMLLFQAQASFELWHGVKPEVDSGLRHFMLDQLRDND